jgi:hypothetical protein
MGLVVDPAVKAIKALIAPLSFPWAPSPAKRERTAR